MDLKANTDAQPYPPTHLLSDYPNSSPHYPKHILSPYSSEQWQGGESLSLLIFFPQPLSFPHLTLPIPHFTLSFPHLTSHPLRQLGMRLPLTTSADNFADQFVDQKISISDYSLSASVACGKFCCATVSPYFFLGAM
jgi:hypothetical protein